MLDGNAQPPPVPNSHAGVLRLWRDSPNGVWHAALQLTTDGPRLGFASLEELFAYLRQLTSPTIRPPEQERSSGKKP